MATGGGPKENLMWIEAWGRIVHGLADEWPLVREAFQEQLVKGFGQNVIFLQTVRIPEFMDQIITEVFKLQGSGQEKLMSVIGILSLANLSINDTGSELSPTMTWSNDRVHKILGTMMEGWTGSQALLKARTCGILDKSFNGHQILEALGSLSAPQFAQSSQHFALGRKEDSTGTLQPLVAPALKNWAFTLWACDQLRIPTVFASATLLQVDQPQALTLAATFVARATELLRCIGHVLRIQLVDNPYTLHRLIIACAAFTNKRDLWNRLEPSVSSESTTKALENLQVLYQTTPWSISNNPDTPATRDSVTIPGSFSDQVIHILEKEIRPCFTHVKAEKIANRAQRTIAAHQEKMRQPLPIIEDTQDSDDAIIDIVLPGNKGLIQQQPTKGSLSSQRIQIASVKDTPNDEEDTWSALDDSSSSTVSGALQPKRWDVNFLEAVPVVEWCARQPIQDTSRIHEVFMLLVAPILAMADSTRVSYSGRGLDLLTGFLIQYHDYSGLNSARNRRPVDSRIWIKIFEKTGLDQVLERALKPLLVPMQLGGDAVQEADDILTDNAGMERVNMAFRAYLTLILVNTEPGGKPGSATAPPQPVSFNVAPTESADLTRLTIENLFLHGILGSFRRARTSKEYQTLILEWMVILVRPVITFDFIWDQVDQQTQLLNVTLPTSDTSKISSEKRFQGIYGMGRRTIKYLPTLVGYLCDVLEIPFPPSPVATRLESLDMARKAVDALIAVMEVSKPRIPRYRGKILAAIASCWANSRVIDSSTGAVKSSNLPQEQSDLDQGLISAMQQCIEICQPKISDQDTPSGLQQDMKVLKELDPTVFDPLFVPQVK
ncbi:hypothetical protein BGX34_010058 [Mortierella sp. NVP85]|nr:hypothetical protein BGX34_010058 [Mortierella sp. NVP85]